MNGRSCLLEGSRNIAKGMSVICMAVGAGLCVSGMAFTMAVLVPAAGTAGELFSLVGTGPMLIILAGGGLLFLRGLKHWLLN
jgi:hypothetical protein